MCLYGYHKNCIHWKLDHCISSLLGHLSCKLYVIMLMLYYEDDKVHQMIFFSLQISIWIFKRDSMLL